jgi:tetratricopeptide (TPR) repeat protein/TolB-like protein
MLCPACHTENVGDAVQCSSCSSSLNLVLQGRPARQETLGGSADTFDSATLAPSSGWEPASRMIGSAAHQSSAAVASATAGPAPIPDFGPRYRVEGKLGEGGMGSVFKAYDLELDRMVALKVIRADLTANAEILQRFKQELLLASRISHKHILRIHDLGEGVGVKFISMAYVEGRNLGELLQEQKVLSLPKAIDIGKQICEALGAAHREGVVHRDLKPQNILIDQAQCVHVSDFGLAKSLESDAAAATAMTSVGQVLGTPRYMSPEQVECGPVDGRSDIYSFGLMLYEMVTGDIPFQGNSLQLMLGRVQSSPRNPSSVNPKLRPYLAGIIMRCLEKDPARRYQTFLEVLDDLEAERATPPGKSPRSKRFALPRQLRKYTVVFVSTVALALIALGGAVGARYLMLRHAQSAAATPPSKFLAVLPFRILNEQSGIDYVSVGVNEALYAKFFGLKDLQIASPAAVQKINPNDPVQKSAHDLGANLVVTGTIQSAGDRLQIIVNLDDVGKGQHLLTQEFSGVRQDLLTIEDQIYAKLLNSIEGRTSTEGLSRVSAHQTENYAAYESYLKGRNAMRGQLDAKNVKAAIQFYEQAVKQDPGFAIAYAGIADANLRMYRLTKDNDWAERAVNAAQQAERLNENFPEVYFALGSAYVATGKTTESISVLKRAVDLAPNSDEGYRRLGDAFRASGNKQEALAAYQHAIQLNPYYWFNYNALGSACVKFAENQKALEAFQRVTELEPDNAAGYQNLSAVYFSMGQFDKSIPFLQKSLELDKHPIGYSNLGTAYFYLRRYDEAVPMFEQAVRLDPGSEINLGNLADAYRWAGKTQQANATYSQAIDSGFKGLAVNSRDAARMGRIAQYYAKKGEQAHAQDLIRRARAVDPNDASLMYAESVVDWLAGREQDATGALKQALSKGYPIQEVRNDPELAKLVALPQFAEVAIPARSN